MKPFVDAEGNQYLHNEVEFSATCLGFFSVKDKKRVFINQEFVGTTKDEESLPVKICYSEPPRPTWLKNND